MTSEQLIFYSSWASLISLAVSLVSLVLIQSIRSHIIHYKQRERIKALALEISSPKIGDEDLTPKLASLRRNFPIQKLSKWTKRGRLIAELHAQIDCGDIAAIREVLLDLRIYEEEP